MINRRDLLEGFLGATASLLATRSVSASPNEKVVVAVIGTGGQGRGHVSSYSSLPNVAVAWVCDVDDARLAEARKLAPNAKSTTDLRRVLDDPAVDAVSIATPDHWHTPAALLALEAGKHVYVEKPCSHNVREGRWLVDAAKNTGKLVQHGTQSRSAPLVQSAIQLLRDGAIGDIIISRAWNVQFRNPIGFAQPSEPPKGFDYDTWVGPSLMVPFQANRHHYSWHWWYDFGTGDAGNDGVHEIDIARWGLGVDTHPSSVAAAGGKYVHQDDQQFPDTMTVVFEYPASTSQGKNRQLIFEMRLWSHNHPHGMDNGNEFLGTKGRLLLTKRGQLQLFDDRDKPVNVKLPAERKAGLVPHHLNFVEAIRSGESLRADALTGHLSATLPHLGNLACRLGRSFPFDAATEQITGDQEANSLLGRVYRDGHWSVPAASGKARATQ